MNRWDNKKVIPDLSQIMKRCTVDNKTDCWNWNLVTTRGYGQWLNKRAHRISYETLVGPIPNGLDLDHLCRNRSCVNPAHLEPVTKRENNLRGTGFPAINSRKTHCPKGHEYSGKNVYMHRNKRHCFICRREAVKRMRAKQMLGWALDRVLG